MKYNLSFFTELQLPYLGPHIHKPMTFKSKSQGLKCLLALADLN